MDCFNNKTIMITGATGLLGSNLVKVLIHSNCKAIIVIGRSRKKLEFVFSLYKNDARLILIEHDITYPLPQNIPYSIDFLFHAASPISGAIIRNKPIDVIQANINGTINCFEHLRLQKESNGIKGKMVVFSSATIYSSSVSTTSVANENDTCHSDALTAATAPYSESKRMIEVIANAYHRQYDIDMLIVRFSYVYGYAITSPDTAFYEFVNKALRGEDIILKNSKLAKRDNIYVDDAISALVHLCQLNISGDIFNISSCNDGGNYAAIDEIAEIIADTTNKINPSKHIQVLYTEKKNEQRPEGIRLNNNKIKATGWSTKYSLKEGIFQTLMQYKNANEIIK